MDASTCPDSPSTSPALKRYTPTARLEAQIRQAFKYHPPQGDQVQRYALLRDRAMSLAVTFGEMTPECREQSLALTHLEQAVMFANAAIARHE